MRATLLDTGPVVAFLSDADVHHATTLQAMRASFAAGRRFCTSWEVIGEACTLMRIRGAPAPSHEGAMAVIGWAWDSGVTILGTTELDHRRAGEILERQVEVRLSYVDALLLTIAERHSLDEVLTVDGAHFPAVRLTHDPVVTVV